MNPNDALHCSWVARRYKNSIAIDDIAPERILDDAWYDIVVLYMGVCPWSINVVYVWMHNLLQAPVLVVGPSAANDVCNRCLVLESNRSVAW